ncbi:MAG: hypothetical protein Q7J84_10795 [Sulfuricaulis sp.]|nr:hypothetical protein [Sulfuricaulis sp.]
MSMVNLKSEHIPVIVGVGEITNRPRDLAQGLEPAALMVESLRRAQQDAGADLIRSLDSLDVINSFSWPYRDLPGTLCEMLGMTPARVVYRPVGGETPTLSLHQAAQRIALGQSTVAAVCGGEAERTVQWARREKFSLPWSAPDPNWTREFARDFMHAEMVKHDLLRPLDIYPLYENAIQHLWGQTPAEGNAESAALWAEYAAVAATNPYAWLPRAATAEEIATASAANRPIAWPYLKTMMAQPGVNQGAAVIVTSLAHAEKCGIGRHKLIHLWGGAHANEPRDVLSRAQLQSSPAMEEVLARAVQVAGDGEFDLLELYSCFPCVPKMARRAIPSLRAPAPTVAGGLTFFGAPVNNYMTHAVAAMVRALRAGGSKGLLYGQGGHVTKHHALVLAREASPHAMARENFSVQAAADARRAAPPPVLADYRGSCVVESHTVLYTRDGAPQHGSVIGRAPGGERLIARVPAADQEAIAFLTDPARSPIGAVGVVKPGRGELLEWSLS